MAERQHVVVQDRDRGLRLLGHVQEAESVGAEGIDHSVQVDPADALQGADHEGIRGQELTRPLALDMALLEAGIELLEERRLLRGQLDRLVGVLALQRQPALVAGAEALVVEDLLDGDRRDPPPLQGQQRLDPVAAIRRMGQRQRLDPRDRFGRRRHRVRLGDRRQVFFEAIQAFELEPPLPVVEAGPVDPASRGSGASPRSRPRAGKCRGQLPKQRVCFLQ